MSDKFSFLFLHDAASLCETLAFECVRAGDDATLVLPSRGLTTYDQLASRTRVSEPGTLNVARSYAQAMVRTDYDVVVAGGRLAWVLGAIAKRVRKAKLVTVLMGSDIRRLEGIATPKKTLMKRSLMSSDFIFYASPDTRVQTEMLGVPCSRIPFPVDTEIFNPKGEAEQLLGDPSVFVPTRLDADKGTGTISRVMGHILKEHRMAHLYVVSWAKARETVDRVVGGLGSDRVTLVDFLKRRTMPRYYRGANILIGQMQLGFGSMTEWESMGCGLPPVYYDAYDGYGVGERSERALSDYFDSLVSDEAFRRRRVEEGLGLVRGPHLAGAVYQEFKDRIAAV